MDIAPRKTVCAGWVSQICLWLVLPVLFSTPTETVAQEAVGLVFFVRRDVVVTRAGSSTAVGLRSGDDIVAGDQIVTGEASQLLVALSTSSRVRMKQLLTGRAPAFWSAGASNLNVGPETTLRVKTQDGQVELVVDKGWISYGASKEDQASVTILTADAVAHVTDGSILVYADPRAPQVAEGSLISMTTLCGSGRVVTGGAIDGSWVYLRTGYCLTIVGDSRGRTQTVYKQYDPNERWVLLRQVAGTGRWATGRDFATEDDCETAATQQHSFGRVAECRQSD